MANKSTKSMLKESAKNPNFVYEGHNTKEIDKDYSTCFIVERYMSSGYFLHFHRNIELYCVVHGKVNVVISGENMMLTDGQIAIISGLESHSYENENEESADIIYFLIGTEYVRLLYNILNGKKPTRWLMDADYNKKIVDYLKCIAEECEKGTMSEIRRYSVVYTLFADIIEHYGYLADETFLLDSDDGIVNIVQYIYEHYKEDLSLKSLSEHFCMAPAVFSRHFTKYVKTDLRVFINDIRVQKVVQLIECNEYRNKSVMEVARECGFTSSMTFYRSYKRNFKFKTMKL